MIGKTAVILDGLACRVVSPSSSQSLMQDAEPAAHQPAASDAITDDAAVLLGANEGQAEVAGTDPPGYLPCQTGAWLPTVTAPRWSRHAIPADLRG